SSLVCVDEHKLLADIEKLIKQQLPREIVPGFEPNPHIKAEPIPNGRQGQAPRRGQQTGRPAQAGGRPKTGRSTPRTESARPAAPRRASQNKHI
ncbi:MAG TPA: hypothetical protein V6D18_00735, partial [Thermosynechococcaceae cyanobacterium]